MSSVLAIIEAETPKGFLRQAAPPSIDRPLPFKAVKVGEWFRYSGHVFKRVESDSELPTYQKGELMQAPNAALVGAIYTFDPESIVYPVSYDPSRAR